MVVRTPYTHRFAAPLNMEWETLSMSCVAYKKLKSSVESSFTQFPLLKEIVDLGKG